LQQAIIHTAVITLVGLAIYYLVFFVIRSWAKAKKNTFPKLFDKHIHLAGLLLCIAIIANVCLKKFHDYILPEATYSFVHYAVNVFLIISAGFLAIKVIALVKDVIIHLYNRRAYKDYTMRSVRTRYVLIQRMLNVVVIVAVIVATLMTIPMVREVSNTLLASAGVAGIILGFAAQKSLGTLFAGIQIAITQPIKIDDTVVVEGQFGTVGEITLTYVVIYTWDEKRLILPINYFLENKIENWTRLSPEVMGSVKVYADYSFPVDQLRKQCLQWIQESPLWDKRKSSVLLTDSNEKTIEIRVAFSAKNSDDAWDLEVQLREKILSYMQENYANMLPTTRVHVNPADKQMAASM
jgi:small-conductance mechanosensitive channel